jgi:DUF971 family protein
MTGIVVAAGTLASVDVPDRIDVADGDRVAITWENGTVSSISASALRAACPCAGCREPSGVAEIGRLLGGDEVIRITAARLVGSYAVSFTFSPDGHATGIFPFDLVRTVGEQGA